MSKVVEKLLSARFVIAILITYTMCYGFVIGRVPSELFVPVALLCLRWYFERPDRVTKKDGE